MIRESLDSRRLKIINEQTNDIHSEVANLNESLVERDFADCLKFINSIRGKINLLNKQIKDGSII